MNSRPLLILLAMLLLGSAPAQVGAITLPLSSPSPLGLDVGFACLSNAASCSGESLLSLAAPAPTTGTLTLSGAAIGAGATTAEISLTLASATFGGLSNGVDSVVFSSMSYTSAAQTAFVIDAGANWNVLAGTVWTANVSGNYAQGFAAGGGIGPSGFSKVVQLTLNCLIEKGTQTGQCGIQFGGARDFSLALGASPVSHDFNHTFNLAVPEPGTAVLILLAGMAMALADRCRPLEPARQRGR